MHRESRTAPHKQLPDEKQPVLAILLNGVFLAGYFTFLPLMLLCLLHWAVYSFAMNNLYQESWTMPALLLLATFLAGAFMRQKMEDENGGMGLFVIGILALIVFSLITYQDIATTGGIYSRFLPKILRRSLLDYLYFLPGVGMLGMLFYKYFTLKHYD